MLLAINGNGNGLSGEPPTLQNMLDKLVPNVAILFSSLLGIALIAMLIYGGVLYMSSGGSPEKKAQAQAVLTWAVAGAVIILAMVMIVNLLGFILGQEGLNSITKGIFQ